MNIERAKRLQGLLEHPGWQDVISMSDELIKEAQDGLINMMDSRPEQLTGKKAIRMAARQKGIKDFIEAINDEIRINLPLGKSPQPGRAGK